jgi:hypothetical protein
VIYAGQFTQVAELLANACSTLPVVSQTVSVNRVKQQVAVQWQTASEQDVRGFNILRQTDENGWKVIQFVPSQAAGDYSSQLLSYQYLDAYLAKGISQYLIQEVNNSGKTTLSEVKVVRGEEQAAKLTIYPNPTTNGKAVVAFAKASIRDVIVSDVSGRVVRQLKNITTSNAVIDQLSNGFYNMQVIDRSTNETTVVRLIVKN